MNNEELVNNIQNGIEPTKNMELLYLNNKGFIYSIAKRYSSYCDTDDLMQEAYFGLYEAVEKYEDTGEAKFVTYARYWIIQAIQRYIDNTCYTVRVPVYMQQLYSQYKKKVNVFKCEYNRDPTDKEASRMLDCNVSTIKNMRKQMYEVDGMDSLDRSINDDGDNMVLADSIIGSNGIENDIVDKVIEKDIKSSLWGIIEKNTSEIENKVINSRYRKDLTLDAIGKEMGVSRERVRQIESAAMKKLRTARVKRILSERYEIAIVSAYRGSVGSFKHTWTSATERAAMKLYGIDNFNIDDTLNEILSNIKDGLKRDII